MNLGVALRRLAERLAERPALLDGATALTYAELDRAADRVARGLALAGIAEGDRVGLLAGNGPPLVAALYGIWRARAVAVPMDPDAATEEIRCILGHAAASAVIADAAGRPVAAGVEDALVGPARILDADDAAWRALAETGPAPAPAGEPDDAALALIAYTAGTSGRPRGAMLRHGHLAANHRQLDATRLDIGEGDVVLGVLPMSHIFGLNVGLCYPLARGAAVCCRERFEPGDALELIARCGVTVVAGVPQMYAAWAAGGGDPADVSTVRFAVSGGAPLPVETAEAFERAFGLALWEGYGLTETAPVLTTTAMGGEPRPGSVGYPLPGVEMRLVDARERPVAPGDPGEVLARGPNVFDGYWRDRAATERALTADGFLRTGDVGYADADGGLHLVGRKGDLIIVNGFNVYPNEVERVLVDHPRVDRAAVVGVPDARTGEAVKAVVVPRAGSGVTHEELARHCRRFLARYKCPAEVEVADELPELPTGELLRRELR